MLSAISLSNGRSTVNLGFGCASLLRLSSQAERQRLLDLAVDLGITHFDVAHLYGLGAAEAELGLLFRRNSGHLTVGTKFGLGNIGLTQALQSRQSQGRQLLKRFPALRSLARRVYGTQMVKRDYSSANCIASLEASLKQMNLEYIDLFAIHEPETTDPIDPTLESLLENLCQEGRIGAYGLSGNPLVLDRILAQRPNLSGGILQWEDSILDRAIARTDRRGNTIGLFGLVRCGLSTLQTAFQAVPQLKHFWSERLCCDLERSEYLVAALLAHGLSLNPEGLVLYATTQPRRLKQTLSILREPPWTSEQLRAFGDFWKTPDCNAHRSPTSSSGSHSPI
ncbi:aldo/keto reductase [Altericista sp. CCNU0014]|uniref:aldo/keto reductase n=1 Tax=Altericista sp. CCNU0014 TaxID=3082949 RepID=UPI00384B51D4